MQQLWVYADFDWLPQPTLVGSLTYESLRGTDSYGFEFDADWLRRYGNVMLSADLQNYMGSQYTAANRDIFGCFADALPDRWGRTLLLRREQVLAQQEGRAVRRLSSFDFLCGIDDASRMGGFRFKRDQDREFINSELHLRVPPLASLRSLEHASREIERHEQENRLPEQKWLAQLVQPGSSLGGARPKASVSDDKGRLYVAKFPSRQDERDVALWEHFSHLMAQRAGITTAQTRVLRLSDKHHTLLSQRFDRTADGSRIHFASAMTLLGLTDGDNAQNGKGYLDIVDFIVAHCSDPNSNLKELFRRVAFNICIGNSDDHFRNHGFLLKNASGWTLSPAYDLNPTINEHQSLLIGADSNEASLQVLRAAAEDYFINLSVADDILREVCLALRNWELEARRLQLPERDIAYFSDRWNKAQQFMQQMGWKD